ncbi:MAG: PrgI family protein [bacterium]|nr:PrgI family protein [bacterium]MDA1292404.1 PrgI family protein [bacterium]
MPIDAVKIPQNVYVEDRIIGPVTLRQIMIIMISTGISYAIWAAMKASGPTSSIQTAIAWMPAGIGTIFSFVKINGLSLLRIMLLLFEKLDKPSRRIWMPRQGIYINIVTKPKEKSSNPDIEKKTQQKGEAQIEELSKLLDQGPHEQEVTTKQKPVNPSRIQVEKREKPVDDIAPPKKNTGSFGSGLMRDITPPPSHA